MSQKVYLVSSGDYSDYSIERIFLSKEKAEAYMKVSNCNYLNELEEYELSDDKIFTPCYYIQVTYYLNNTKPSYVKDTYSFEIITSNTEETSIEDMRNTYYSGNYLVINRPIYSQSFDENYLKQKYKKVCEDLTTQIKSFIEIEGWNEKMIYEWLKDKQTIISENE